MDQPIISEAFPFTSHYVDVLGSRMHYIDEGSGDPILFLHGNPTSCYLWRNIIPYLTPHGRCIAPDLIGMGKSDKPHLPYRFFDHARYVEGFINALGLKHVTLVVHDWGSGLGFHYASRHEDNIKALAFMEAILRPMRWSDFPKDFRTGFKLMRKPVLGWLMICVMNVFIKQILPQATVRKLSGEEKRRYEEPFPDVASRRPIRQWPLEIPIEGMPRDMYEVVEAYYAWLQKTSLPKILFHATPGGIIGAKEVAWCQANLKHLTTVDLGQGIHYLQEDNPHAIGSALAAWYTKLSG